MRCQQCNEYIPENLGIKNCIRCDIELREEVDAKNEISSAPQTQQTIETKLQELTKEQEVLVEERLNKGLKSLLYASILWIFFVLLTLIPIKFIPTRKAQAIQGFEANQAFAEYFGIIPTFIILFILGVFIFTLVLRHSKFLNLKKDLKEKKSITIISKIANIRELKGDREKEYDVFLEKNTENLKKLNFLKSEFPDIRKGDIIKVTFTKNAHCVMSTEIVNEFILN